jgi:hypothetical protein
MRSAVPNCTLEMLGIVSFKREESAPIMVKLILVKLGVEQSSVVKLISMLLLPSEFKILYL